MTVRTRGRWWLNKPWYTDWAMWLGAALGVLVAATVLVPAARETPIDGAFGTALLALMFVMGLVEWPVLLVVLRGLCRAVFRVPRGPLGVPRSLRVPVRDSTTRGAVIYSRARDGTMTVRFEGLPANRHAEALAATRERAARAGFVSGGGAA